VKDVAALISYEKEPYNIKQHAYKEHDKFDPVEDLPTPLAVTFLDKAHLVDKHRHID
jgi:hypothetical protein